MSKAKSGGGINSRVVKQDTKWKAEPKGKAINPASVSTLGMATQFKKPNLEMGPGYQTKPQPSTGIANARKGHAGVGPGGGNRTIFPTGAQGTHGKPVPAPGGKPRDILSEYGPERSKG
jgi:hypothetical protein